MPRKDIEKQIKEIATKYPNLEVKTVDYENGRVTLNIGVTGGKLVSDLPDNIEIIEETPGNLVGKLIEHGAAAAPRLSLDPLTRGDLDLARPSILTAKPQDLYKRSIEYYRSKDVYGTSINVLTNFAAKGFENDIDDVTIRNFFDNWMVDTGFDDIVEKVFFDFFRVGMVRTYKVIGPYKPKINFLPTIPGQPAKEVSHRGSPKNTFIPIAYTILNPTAVEIKGSLLFGQTSIFLKAAAGQELKPLLELPLNKLSEQQKVIISNLPSTWKKAIIENQDIPLDPNLVGEIDYRRMPYERYPYPRGSRAFEALEFKDELRKADYSTLDGITNYILKITVGSDDHPVTKQEILDNVAELFNTVSKSYKIVWNHTLNIEKITSPEIGEVLGKDKYLQVNDDVTGALGILRALLDGLGNSPGDNAQLAVKSVIEEINYARRQVQRWIYSEYRAVAEAMGFDRYPKIRFDDMALKDEIQLMSIVQGMIDRRIISYRTGQKKLGFDPETELSHLQEEKDLVLNGDLGIIGSPYQQSRNQIQPTQSTPKGTPSEGRPRAKPAVTPAPPDATKPKTVRKKQVINNSEKASVDNGLEMVFGRPLSEVPLEELKLFFSED